MTQRTIGLALSFVATITALAADGVAEQPAAEALVRGPAFETNVLWPFFPGGLVDFRVVIPVAQSTSESGRVALVLGVYSDFAWRIVRDDTYGRVAAMGTKLGVRAFWRYGLHLEPSVQLNWRHETDRPGHPEPLDGFQGRFWIFAGHQHDLGRRVYLNARGGVGFHLFRTDELGDQERKVVPAADVNLGIRW